MAANWKMTMALALAGSVHGDEVTGNKKCRALSLMGGGVKGNYETGVLQSLYDNLPEGEVAWDVTTGVSIGAINTATLGIYEKGDEKAAIAKMHEYWKILDTSTIFVQWPRWSILAGFWEPSFFDNTPSHESVNERLANPMKRRVAFQAVDLNDGSVKSFDEKLDPKLQGESVVASASIPVAFQPTTTIGNFNLVDGGTYSNMNLQAAILKCKEVVEDDSDIILDVVLDTDAPITLPEYEPWQNFNSYNIHKRPKAFSTYHSVMDLLYRVVAQNPLVNLRYIVTASQDLPGGFLPIFVKPDDLLHEYHIGYQDGIKAIKNDTIYQEFHRQVGDYQHFVLRDGFE